MEDDPGLEWLFFCNSDNPEGFKTVCQIPSDLRRQLGAHTSSVWIRRDYAQKATQKHRLTAHHLPMMATMIHSAACYRDKLGELAFFYGHPYPFNEHLFLVLKTSHAGAEIWVKSFHWKREGERVRITKKMTLIRPPRD